MDEKFSKSLITDKKVILQNIFLFKLTFNYFSIKKYFNTILKKTDSYVVYSL